MKRGALLLLLTFFFSCAQSTQGNLKTAPVQEEQIKEQILGENVPIYPGFKLVSSKSLIYESGSLKVGRLVFSGRAQIKSLVSYYKAVLPEKGWEPLSITINGNSAQMTFTNPGQVLQIEAAKGFSETTLIIQIGPKGELTNQQ